MKTEVVYNTLSDLELIRMLKSGDEAAYTEIFFRYNRLLYAHAYKMLGDKEEARDVVQEIFALLWKNRLDFILKDNLGGFLYTTTRNRILDLFSRKAVISNYIKSIEPLIHRTEASADHLIRTNELTTIIEKEIDLLPIKMKLVFNLSRKGNLSHKEIAAQLNLTEKTVKNQVNNALKVLRSKFGIFYYLLFIFCFK